MEESSSPLFRLADGTTVIAAKVTVRKLRTLTHKPPKMCTLPSLKRNNA